jgi:hypothetical protein
MAMTHRDDNNPKSIDSKLFVSLVEDILHRPNWISCKGDACFGILLTDALGGTFLGHLEPPQSSIAPVETKLGSQRRYLGAASMGRLGDSGKRARVCTMASAKHWRSTGSPVWLTFR